MSRENMLAALGSRIRVLRKTRGLSLRALADAASVSERFLISVEQGAANISVVRLLDIAVALGSDPATLLSGAIDAPKAVKRGFIALLGMRGAGKTAIGTLAAPRLGMEFVELDRRVETQAGMGPGEIFELHGREYYRKLERDQLQEVLARGTSAMVATAGGLVTDHQNFGLVRSSMRTIWLKAKAEDHMSRVLAQGDARPMANRKDAMKQLRALLRARRALYEQAHHVIDTSAVGLERAVDRVVEIAQLP